MGETMAALLQTPVDPLSQLPLAIAPNPEWLPIRRSLDLTEHHAFHPKSHPVLHTLAGQALRNSRIQIVEAGLHNDGPQSYHAHFAGPEIPTSEADIFVRCVATASGAVSEEVIDLSRGEPFTRPALQSELAILRGLDGSKRFRYERWRYAYEPMRDFFRDYVLGKRLDDSHISADRIDEFFHTTDQDAKRYLGNLLIAKAAGVASDEVRSRYLEWRLAGRLFPGFKSSPFWMIKYKLGNDSQRTELIPVLERKLRAHYGLPFVEPVAA